MTEIRSRVLSGLKWSGLSQVAQQIVQFAIYVILARLLSPREFGLVGMVVVLTGFADIFVEMGLGSALIQKQDATTDHSDSVFWINIVFGVFLMCLFALSSGLIAYFYGEPILSQVTIFLASNFFITSVGIVQRNLFSKTMDFKTLFRVDALATIIGGLLAISMAVHGFGVWSLVAQSITINALSTALLWHFSSWRPSFRIRRAALAEMFRFSSNMLGFNILNFLSGNLDKILVGRLTGPVQLGFYSRAYQLMVMPINQISGILTRVMFPALSIIQDNKAKVKEAYLHSTQFIALITFPLMMGLFVLAKPFTLAFFGSKWTAMIPVLRIFCLIGIGQSIGTTTGWLYTSQGRTDIMFRWSIFAGAVRLISIIVGLKWGIIGVAAAYVLSGYLLIYPSWSLAGRLINMRFREMIWNLKQIFLCAVAMTAIVFLIDLSLPAPTNPWIGLLLSGFAGISSYLGLLHFYRVEGYVELRSLLLQEFGKHVSASHRFKT